MDPMAPGLSTYLSSSKTLIHHLAKPFIRPPFLLCLCLMSSHLPDAMQRCLCLQKGRQSSSAQGSASLPTSASSRCCAPVLPRPYVKPSPTEAHPMPVWPALLENNNALMDVFPPEHPRAAPDQPGSARQPIGAGRSRGRPLHRLLLPCLQVRSSHFNNSCSK